MAECRGLLVQEVEGGGGGNVDCGLRGFVGLWIVGLMAEGRGLLVQ